MNPSTFSSPPSDACTPATPGSYGQDRIAKTSYSAADQISKIEQAYGTTDVITYTQMTYTDNGKVSTLTDANANVTTYTYDVYDRADKIQFPNKTGGGSSTTDYKENASYDANSNVTSFRLRDGNTVTATYDNLNRLKGRSGATVAARTMSYDNVGELTGSTLTGGISVGFAYDALARVTGETSPLGTMTTGYDLAGRRTSLAWPDGFSVTYNRFVTGELNTVVENGTGGITPISYSYDDLGHVTGIGKANNHGQSFSWDNASRLTALSTALPSATSTIYPYYNPANQVYSRSTSDDQLSSNVAYNVNRSYQANGLNQYTKAGTPGTDYDANGNLTRLASNTFSYDGDNRLNGGSGGTGLSYDPLNRLYQVPDNVGTRFAYSGGMIVGEYGSSGNLLRRYLPGDGVDNPLVWYEGTGIGDRRYLAIDERGSITEVSNQAGATLAINMYDDWGVPAAGNLGRFGYTGQTWLPSVQAWNYKARIYNPVLGRFLQTDPVGYSNGNNWYNYVQGDPINATDPSGKIVWFLVPVMGAAIGGVGDFTMQEIVNFNRGKSWKNINWNEVGLATAVGATGGWIGGIAGEAAITGEIIFGGAEATELSGGARVVMAGISTAISGVDVAVTSTDALAGDRETSAPIGISLANELSGAFFGPIGAITATVTEVVGTAISSPPAASSPPQPQVSPPPTGVWTVYTLGPDGWYLDYTTTEDPGFPMVSSPPTGVSQGGCNPDSKKGCPAPQ